MVAGVNGGLGMNVTLLAMEETKPEHENATTRLQLLVEIVVKKNREKVGNATHCPVQVISDLLYPLLITSFDLSMSLNNRINSFACNIML